MRRSSHGRTRRRRPRAHATRRIRRPGGRAPAHAGRVHRSPGLCFLERAARRESESRRGDPRPPRRCRGFADPSATSVITCRSPAGGPLPRDSTRHFVLLSSLDGPSRSSPRSGRTRRSAAHGQRRRRADRVGRRERGEPESCAAVSQRSTARQRLPFCSAVAVRRGGRFPPSRPRREAILLAQHGPAPHHRPALRSTVLALDSTVLPPAPPSCSPQHRPCPGQHRPAPRTTVLLSAAPSLPWTAPSCPPHHRPALRSTVLALDSTVLPCAALSCPARHCPAQDGTHPRRSLRTVQHWTRPVPVLRLSDAIELARLSAGKHDRHGCAPPSPRTRAAPGTPATDRPCRPYGHRAWSVGARTVRPAAPEAACPT